MRLRLEGNRYEQHVSPLLAAGETRPLAVVLDVNCLDSVDEAIRSLLLGLLRNDAVDLLRYLESARESSRVIGPGWLHACSTNDDGGVSHVLRFHRVRDSGPIETAIFGAAARPPRLVHGTPYDDLDVEMRDRIAQETLLVAAAKSVHADLVICDPLLVPDHHRFRDITIRTPAEALWSVSFFLRSRGTFLGYAEPGGHKVRFNRGLHRSVGVRALIPHGNAWWQKCLVLDRGDVADIAALAQSVGIRMERCLAGRDDVIRALSLPQNNDLADDALASMDAALLFLLAAFDSTARVAHRVLGLGGSEHDAGWQRQRWLRKVGHHVPALDALVAPDTVGGDMLRALRALRNTIHGAAMTSVRFEDVGPAHPETLVELPATDASDLREVLDRRGWAGEWGLRELGLGAFHARPDGVVDHLVKEGAHLLDRIMSTMPVGDAILHVEEHPGGEGQTTQRPTNPFAEPFLTSVRRQYALPEPQPEEPQALGHPLQVSM